MTTTSKRRQGRRAGKTDLVALSERELATVLAALRFFQKEVGGFSHPEWMPHFGDFDPLSRAEIDQLCEQINA